MCQMDGFRILSTAMVYEGKKKRGEGEDFDENLIPGMRKELRDYPLRDVFNCDELDLQ